MRIEGTVSLVTGASSGIGRASALRLASRGSIVHVLGRNHDALNVVAAQTRGRALIADFADADQTRAAAEAAAQLPLDILVNCAGAGTFGRFVDLPADAIDRLLRVNLHGAVHLTHAVLPGMLARGRGHLVNVGSISANVGVPDEAVYAAAKGGLLTFTESLGYELAGTAVGVSLVTPGAIDTAFIDRRGVPYQRRFPRKISPDLVADAVLQAIVTSKAEVFVPRWMRLPAQLKGTLPNVYRTLARRFGGGS